MHTEKQYAKLKSSPLFQLVCLLMQGQQGWSGLPKQFKETLCSRFPDAFATWYRMLSKFVEELKEITPALQEGGIGVSFPSEATLVTLTRAAERLSPSE